MKENLESKAQIYGVYWSYETVLSMIWSVVRDNIDRNNEFFIYQDFMNRLASAIKTSDCYKDPEFRYVPKEDLVGCVMTVFYELFWPSLDNIKKWENSVQVTFRQLKTVVAMHMNSFKTKEARIMLFLLRFRNQILDKSNLTEEKVDFFIKFAA